jgi:hypothetical protein
VKERELFIGTQFSNLYTAVDRERERERERERDIARRVGHG